MNTLESWTLRLIGEDVTTPDVFVNTSAGLAQIRDSLNDAIEELCMVTGYYRRRYYLALMEERAIYRLHPRNDYCGWVIGAWDRDTQNPLEQTDLLSLSTTEPWFLKSNGNPKWFYPLGWQYVGFYPRPGTKGKILELETISIPRPYTHGYEARHIRAEWQRAAVYRAVSDYHASRGDAQRGGEWFAKYVETANLMALKPDQSERLWRYRGQVKEGEAG